MTGTTMRVVAAVVLSTAALVSRAAGARAEDAPAPTPAVEAPKPPEPAAPPPPPPPAPAPAPEASPPKDTPAATSEVLPADVPKPATVPPPPAPTPAEASMAGAALPADVPVAMTTPPGFGDCCLHGTVAVRYRMRSTPDENDNDLYEYLTLRYRKDSDVGWSGSVYGRLAEDLDGHQDNSGFYVFDGVDDTFSSAVTGRLYHAYASYRFGGGVLERVRVGRQDVEGGYPFLIDGVHVLSAPRGPGEVQVWGYGGLPAHLYEASPKGDLIAGGGIGGRPWCGGDLRFDWAHVEDENAFYGKPINDLFTLEWRQRFSEWTHGRFWYQQVDDDPREAGATVTAFSPRYDATIRGSFRSQLEWENSLVYDLDPYYAIEQSLAPYWDAHLAVAKALSSCFTLEVGGTGRGLWDDADKGTFNREFARVYATLSADAWPTSCWSLALTADYWAGHDHVFAGGFEATWKPGGRFRLDAGVDYSLWRTDLYTATERFDSWGGHVRATWAFNSCWKADLSVRVEDDDIDTFVTVQAGVRFEF